MTLTDWTGIIGVALLLVAFFLNLRDVVKKNSLAYIVLNLVGAGVACLASIMLYYWPFIILEGCWTLVSAIELARYLNKRGEITPK